MSVVRKVFSDSAFTAVRSLTSLARRIVLLPIITKLMGADVYGLWVTILATVTLISSTGSLHLHGSLIRYESEEEKRNQTYSDVLFLALLTGVLLAAGVIGLGLLVDVTRILGESVTDQVRLVVVVAALVAAKKLFLINVNYPRARGHVKLYDLLLLCRDFLETILLASVFLLGGGIIDGLTALAGFLMGANIVLCTAIAIKSTIRLPNPDNFRRYLRYGLPMIPKEISTTLLSNADKYLIIYFISPTAVGIYTAAKGICPPLVMLTKIFDSTLYPTIGEAWDKNNYAQISDVYGRIFRFYSILALPAVAGLVLLSEPLLRALTTETIVQEAVYLVPIFVVGYYLKGYDNSIRYILTAAKKTEIIGGSVMLTVLVNIGLNVLLIPIFGITGAAVATVVSQTLLFGIIMYSATSIISVNVPWQTIARSTVAAAVMAVVLYFLHLDLSVYSTLVVYPVLGAAIHFAFLQLLGEFSRTEINYVKDAVRQYGR